MTQDEANLISGLFDRISQTPAQPQDFDAARLIHEKIAANPNATYVLTQSVLVLQQAVTAAQGRIAELEKQLADASSRSPQGGGGFLSGVANLFGTPQPPAPYRAVAPSPLPQQAASPVPASPQGGGFLQNAMATAAGVAGGALLFQGIENLMGHNPGPFGGMGSGFGGGFAGGNQPTEIINNYYETPSQGDDQQDFSGDDDLQSQDNSADMTDDGGLFSGGDDDSSFV